MEKQQAFEWAEAQKIVISTDLIVAAQKQLHFLEIVDHNRQLYNGPALDRAILRYKNCWFPLLAKHAESKFPEGHLVVPLDCEWIWHCHRLNPVRYITDCKELFGKILGTSNVVSSTQGTCTKKTEKIWKMSYPEEPYELNIASENKMVTLPSTDYDLVSAVKRQSTFFYQVSKSYMKDNMYLEGAVERYKGFLHLIRRNAGKKSKRFYVPTYDIDLIWHSHQLNPVSYSRDVRAIVGNVLQHDDSDSSKVKGGKLDTGFRETTKQWEDTLGLRYWRAGAMYRGPPPSPLAYVPQLATILSKNVSPKVEYQDIVKLPTLMLVEVLLEVAEVRNVAFGNKGGLIVRVSKKSPDFFFKTRINLSVSLDAGAKQAVCFQCEPTGDLTFDLTSYFPSESKPTERSLEILGTTSVSLQELMNSGSKLSIQKWSDLEPPAGTICSEPISLKMAISVAPPVPGPYKITLVKGYPIARNLSSFPLLERVEKAKKWTVVVDEAGNEVFSIQMRAPKKIESGNISTAKKEVHGMAKYGETYLLAEFNGEGWLFTGSHWFLSLKKNGDVEDVYICELVGSKKMIMFHGKKLGYEIKNGNKKENEGDFMTLVEFSSENPYGKSVALLNLRTGFLEVVEKQLVLPAITLAIILSDILIKKDGYDNKDHLAKRAEKLGEYWWKGYEEGGGGHENMNTDCGLFNAACSGSDCGLKCSASCSAGCSSQCSSSCMSK